MILKGESALTVSCTSYQCSCHSNKKAKVFLQNSQKEKKHWPRVNGGSIVSY